MNEEDRSERTIVHINRIIDIHFITSFVTLLLAVFICIVHLHIFVADNGMVEVRQVAYYQWKR